MTKQQFIKALHGFCIQAYEKWLMFKLFCHLQMDGLRLSFAIFMCDSLQRAYNKRFYVIRNAKNRLIWVCNDDIKSMRKPRRVRKLIHGKLYSFKVSLLPKDTSHLDVMKAALYFTPTSRNNTDGLSPAERYARRAKWINYMEQIRLNRITGKLKAAK